MSDTNAAALVAAIETLGAEIIAQRNETQWYADRATEREVENDRLRGELAQAQQRADAATKQAAALMERLRSDDSEWEHTGAMMNAAGVGFIRFDPTDEKWEAGDSEGAIVHRAYTLSAAVAMLRGAAANGKAAQA